LADAAPAGAPVPPPSPMTAVMANQYAQETDAVKDRARLVNDRDWRSTGALRFKLARSTRWKLANAPRRSRAASEPAQESPARSRPSTAPAAGRCFSDVGPQPSAAPSGTRPVLQWPANAALAARPWWEGRPGSEMLLNAPAAAPESELKPTSQVARSVEGSRIARSSSVGAAASRVSGFGAEGSAVPVRVASEAGLLGRDGSVVSMQSGARSALGPSEVSMMDKPMTLQALQDVFQQLDATGEGVISKAALVRALRKSSSLGAVTPAIRSTSGISCPSGLPQESALGKQSQAASRLSRPGSAVAGSSMVAIPSDASKVSMRGPSPRHRPASASCVTASASHVMDEPLEGGRATPTMRRPKSASVVGNSAVGRTAQATSQVSAASRRVSILSGSRGGVNGIG